jgi:lysophospholipase L1-like esterase
MGLRPPSAGTGGGTGLFADSTDPFRYDSTRLGKWVAARAARDTAPVRILGIGDSIMEGDQNTVATRWWNKLQDGLRATYPVAGSPPGGLGFIPALYIATNSITNPIVYTGTKTPSTGGLGMGRGYQLSAGATATLTFTGTGVDIIYLVGSTAGNFTWAVDGGGATTVNSNAAATARGFSVQIRGLTAGSHTVVVTAVGTTFLDGFFVYNGDEAKGFNMFEGAHAGGTSGDLIDATSSAYDMHRFVAPHLGIIDLGTNDWLVGNAPASRLSPRQFAANLRDHVAAIRSAGTDPSIILVEPAKRGAINTLTASKGQYSDFIQAGRRVAWEDGRITIFDRQAVMGDQSAAGNTLVGADKVHPNAAGHTAVANALLALLQSV